MATSKQYMFKTQSPDREVFNIVYDTFRHLVHKK